MERFADAKSALEQGLRISPDDCKLKEALAELGPDWAAGVVVGGYAPVPSADREASAKRYALDFLQRLNACKTASSGEGLRSIKCCYCRACLFTCSAVGSM